MTAQIETRNFNDRKTNPRWFLNRFEVLAEFLEKNIDKKLDGEIIFFFNKQLAMDETVGDLSVEFFENAYAQLSEEKALAEHSI